MRTPLNDPRAVALEHLLNSNFHVIKTPRILRLKTVLALLLALAPLLSLFAEVK